MSRQALLILPPFELLGLRVLLLELLVMDIQLGYRLLPAPGLHFIAAEGPLASPLVLDLLGVKWQRLSFWGG